MLYKIGHLYDVYYCEEKGIVPYYKQFGINVEVKKKENGIIIHFPKEEITDLKTLKSTKMWSTMDVNPMTYEEVLEKLN